MIPVFLSFKHCAFSVPRVGGGDPSKKNAEQVLEMCSPRRRG